MDFKTWLDQAAEELYKVQLKEFGPEVTKLSGVEFNELVEDTSLFTPRQAFKTGLSPKQYIADFTGPMP